MSLWRLCWHVGNSSNKDDHQDQAQKKGNSGKRIQDKRRLVCPPARSFRVYFLFIDLLDSYIVRHMTGIICGHYKNDAHSPGNPRPQEPTRCDHVFRFHNILNEGEGYCQRATRQRDYCFIKFVDGVLLISNEQFPVFGERLFRFRHVTIMFRPRIKSIN